LSLQEAEDWTKAKTNNNSFANTRIITEEAGSEHTKSKLGFSRAYSLALAPHIIYTRSSLLPLLVSSRSDQQLEFLAVGSWFVFTPAQDGITTVLARVPSSREDLFADASVDMRAKRALMKFLRFVGDYENHSDWQDPNLKAMPLHTYLLDRFNLPVAAQAPFNALTLSPYPPRRTTTAFGLPRIARHLRSLGLFGPGFGAVIPKWGGLAEIAQVGCRQGAVGGAVYVLGTGVEDRQDDASVLAAEEAQKSLSPAALQAMKLSSGDEIKTKWLAGTVSTLPAAVLSGSSPQETPITVSRSIAIISSPLRTLFPSLADGAPQPAVAVVVCPTGSLSNMDEDTPPVHLFIHSSETGECPVGQCKHYLLLFLSPSPSMMTKMILPTLSAIPLMISIFNPLTASFNNTPFTARHTVPLTS
jgi:RAB protein geranylgeranyltransferase component A